MKKNLYSISEEELAYWLKSKGEAEFRKKQINHWLWKSPVCSVKFMKNLPKKLIDKLDNDFYISYPLFSHESKSSDATIKYLFSLEDGISTEGVLIPSKDRVTACISTQVGCKMGCDFCATGKMGFFRNLEMHEIYLQAYFLNKLSIKNYGKKLSNIVVMGMGEPLDNYENTHDALKLIMSKKGMEMSYRRITMSTVGIVPEIKKLADSGLNAELSVSLHAANNSLRNSIMPINKKYDLNSLAKSLQYFHEKTGKRISYEYILLKGINDSKEDAKALAEFTKITPCKINLIEYNPFDGVSYKKSGEKETLDFMKTLEKRNLIVKLRRSRGKDIDAACGQLANKMH